MADQQYPGAYTGTYPGATGPFFTAQSSPAVNDPGFCSACTGLFGGNCIFLSLVPFVLATCMQTTGSIRNSLIVGTAMAGAVLLLGLLLYFLKGRQVTQQDCIA